MAQANRQIYFGMIALILIAVFAIFYFQPTSLSQTGLPISKAVNVSAPAEKTGPLSFDSISSSHTYGGVSDIFTPISVTIPTQESIASIEVILDGKSFQKGSLADFGETTPAENETQRISLWGYLDNMRWMKEGIHILKIVVTTLNGSYQNQIRVTVDITPPTVTIHDHSIVFTDTSGIDGITVSLFDEKNGTDPTIIHQYDTTTFPTSYTADLSETNEWVTPNMFRYIVVNDRAGNATILTPDRKGSIEDVMQTYREAQWKRLAKDPDYAEKITLAGNVQRAILGPIVYVGDTPLPPTAPGVWDGPSKMNNFIETVNKAQSIFRNAGKSFNYTHPELQTVTAGDFAPTSFANAQQDYGMQPQGISFPIGPIGAVDYGNPLVVQKIEAKMKQLRAANPGKIPVLIADVFFDVPNPANPGEKIRIGMGWSANNFILMNYALFTSYNAGTGFSFDSVYAGKTLAHELGHAAGLDHAYTPSNLQYNYEEGVSWDLDQTVVVAGHIASEKLMPKEFGGWFPYGSQEPENLCSNRRLGRGYANHNAPGLFESAEDTFAGSFTPQEATTVELNDWHEYDIDWAKFCPITKQVVLDTGVIEYPNPPVAVPSKWDDVTAMIDAYLQQNKLPVLEVAPYPANEYPSVGIYACGCYTMCEVACNLANLPDTDSKADDKANAKFLCDNVCQGDPNYIIKDAEKLKNMIMPASNPNGESCAANTDTSSPNPTKWKSKGNFGNSNQDFCSPKDDCKMWEAKAGTSLKCDFQTCTCKVNTIIGNPPEGH